jgi:glucokinase
MGCWERYASGSGLKRLILEAAKEGQLPTLLDEHRSAEGIRPEDVTRAAAEGLDEAIDLLRQISWWLALGLSNLVAILDAGHFVIGGGLSSASDLVLPFTREYLANLVEGYQSRPAITVTGSMFGPRSGAMGAALIAFERNS